MGGDIKGGGMTHYEIPQMMNTAYQYSEGLQTPWPSYALELDNFANTMTMGKKKGYDRGVIVHFRSNATQHLTYHMLYGGFRKSVIERWVIRYFWKRLVKQVLPVFSVLWVLQTLGHRDYDNNAYAYFYFSD